MTRVTIVGIGATGSHAARQLRFEDIDLAITDSNRKRLGLVLDALEGDAARGEPRGDLADVAILALPAGSHGELAERLVRAGTSVVSVSDHPADTSRLLALDGLAQETDCTIAAGAGFAPGFSCLLARLAAQSLQRVDEVAIASTGTGGPACARQHHWALKSDGEEWLDGRWVVRKGGSGRELAWFPDPLGGMDCYRAALASPRLLHPVFPEAQRISARLEANRRDRLTMGLPMLRPPHADGGPGGVRVEVRGIGADGYQTEIFGAMHHPAAASGIVAACTALEIANGNVRRGAGGLAALSDHPGPWLAGLRKRGLTAARFSGSS